MKALVCLSLVLAVLGCATHQPIENVIDAPATAASGKPLSLSEVATAIQRAGKLVGWQIIVDGPGLFTGRLALRSHLAVVNIEHDTRAYSIRYRQSTNLDARDGQIHKAYNEWVQNLDKAIRAELDLL